jgi:phage recombination protein Bet
MSNQIAVMAQRLNIAEKDLGDIVRKTIMPDSKRVTVSNEQFVSFMAVANEYKLNPLVKEIYAFPAKGGGIQPVVSIDGWIKIITSHPDFDGMEHDYEMDDSGNCISVTCSIYRKSHSRPISATEYLAECLMPTDVWRKYPRRMLRHKATIQAGRYAFGISGIIDPDEADRYAQAKVIEKDDTFNPPAEMMEEATFTGWDFVEVWGIGENQTYPYLRKYVAGDLNHDGIVDWRDFAIFALHWLEETDN